MGCYSFLKICMYPPSRDFVHMNNAQRLNHFEPRNLHKCVWAEFVLLCRCPDDDVCIPPKYATDPPDTTIHCCKVRSELWFTKRRITHRHTIQNHTSSFRPKSHHHHSLQNHTIIIPPEIIHHHHHPIPSKVTLLKPLVTNFVRNRSCI
jgi:hypothetical protein